MLKENTPSRLTPSNNVIMEKIEKIEEKLETYESSNKDMKNSLASNMEALDGLNTKLDKISQLLGVENGGKMNESYPVRHSILIFDRRIFRQLTYKLKLIHR